MRFHYYEIQIPINKTYRMLNSINSLEIRNLNIYDKYTQFEINSRQLEELKEVLNNTHIPILHIKPVGIKTKIVKFNFLKYVIICASVFVLLLLINSLFIWKISVDGNYSYSDNQIIKFLKENLIEPGIIKTSIDCNKIETDLRNTYKDISWVCVEIKGTNLLVHIKENYITEIASNEDNPYDLISNKEGKIVSIVTRKGKALKNVGDIVNKNDILISGAIDVKDESDQTIFYEFVNADADIVLETKYLYKNHIDIKHNKKIYSSVKSIYFPGIVGMDIFKLNKEKNVDVYVENNPIKLFGNCYLPLTIDKITTRKFDVKTLYYSENEAKKILLEKFNEKLSLLEQKDYKIIEKNVKIFKDEQSIGLSAVLLCHEPVGKVKYIDKNKFIEELTTVNERN